MPNTPAPSQQLNSSTVGDVKTEINVEFEIRNVLVGCLGFMANVVAFVSVLKTGQVTKGRKLLLLNLTVTDCVFMASMCMYGFDSTETRMSEGKGCVPMIFFIILGILSSLVTCLMLSVVNFLAVYKPFQYMRLVSWKYTGIGITVSWLILGGMMLWWTGLQFPPGLTCAPIAILPVKGLVGMTTITMITSIGVFLLNIAAILKLKKKSPFRCYSTCFNPIPLRNRVRPINLPTKTASSFVCEPGTSLKGNKSEDPPSVMALDDRSKSLPGASSIWMGDNDYEEPCPHVLAAEVNGVHPGYVECQPTISSSTSIDTNQSVHKPSPSQLHNADVLEERKGRTNDALTQPANPFARRDKVCKILVILTSYSCILTLPMAVYLMCIATKVIEDPEKMVGTPLGIFMSSCPILKSAVNPFFYVLKFVNWQKVSDILKRRP